MKTPVMVTVLALASSGIGAAQSAQRSVILGAGFDWLLLDMEHAPNELPSIIAQLQAIGVGQSAAIVRPAWNDAVLIKRILDAGAQNLLVPYVQTVEEARAAVVKDVSKARLALACGLTECPGFDLLSKGPGAAERAIEVKGRAGIGDIELTENEWAKACNLREKYWLYVVFDCGTPTPRLVRVQDPFRKLVANAKGGVIIDEREIFLAGEKA